MVKRLVMALFLGVIAVTVSVMGATSADASIVKWKHHTVFVVDSTTKYWDVNRAAEIVDNNSGLDLVWTVSCPPKAQCVYVENGDLPDGVGGNTKLSYSGKYITGATITFPWWGSKAPLRVRRMDMCHELLHSVGLRKHRHTTKSCLNWSLTLHGSDRPDALDYHNLRIRYGK